MTFQHLFERLSSIDQEAFSLLQETGFHSDDELGNCVCPLKDLAQDAFLRDKAEELLDSLEQLHDELCYLKRPVLGVYHLEKFPDGHYGYFDAQGNRHSFSCGQTIEVKIHDHFGRLRWVKTRVEHDGADYFLWGGRDVPLAGLTARRRGYAV